MHERLLLSAAPLELEVYSGIDVIQEMTHSIRQMGSDGRVALTTMSFEPSEPLVADMVSALHDAAEHGAPIHLGVDAFTFLVDNTSGSIGPLLAPNPYKQAAFHRRQQALRELDAHGQHVTVRRLNEPEHLLQNPFAGRSHIKAAVIGDRCFVIGPNLHQTERIDMGVSFESPAVADRLYQSLVTLIEHGDTRAVFGDKDRAWQLDPNTQLLIDSGRPGQSIIMDRALQLIDKAYDEELIISLQYAPRGQLARSLARAVLDRQVQLRALYNHPDTQGLIGGLAERLALRRARRQGVPADLFAHQLADRRRDGGLHNHAKVLRTRQAVIVGSNNFDQRGVNFGTTEMSLLRERDPDFAQKVGELTCRLLNVATPKRDTAYQAAA